jgi:hypothetical protein
VELVPGWDGDPSYWAEWISLSPAHRVWNEHGDKGDNYQASGECDGNNFHYYCDCVFKDPDSKPVPVMSTWALVTMALLLVAVTKVLFRACDRREA